MSKVHHTKDVGSGLVACGLHVTKYNCVMSTRSKVGVTCKKCLKKLKEVKRG